MSFYGGLGTIAANGEQSDDEDGGDEGGGGDYSYSGPLET